MIPHYLLRAMVMPGGVRLAPLPELVKVAGICPFCSKAVLIKKIIDRDSTQGIYWRAEWWHYDCHAKSGFDWMEPIQKKGKKKRDDYVPPGNLDSEEYRFWVGGNFEPKDTTWSECRCCHTVAWSKMERQAHLKDEARAVNGERCSGRLVKAYKELVANPDDQCLVCHQLRYKTQKWGAPVCFRAECIRAWKFDSHKYMRLEQILYKQETKAKEAARKKAAEEMAKALDEGKKVHVNFTPDPVTPIFRVDEVDAKTGEVVSRPWCKSCNMFADNASHGQIHAAYEISRNSTRLDA